MEANRYIRFLVGTSFVVVVLSSLTSCSVTVSAPVPVPVVVVHGQVHQSHCQKHYHGHHNHGKHKGHHKHYKHHR